MNPNFDETEERIIRTLYANNRYMSTYEISKASGIAWQTVNFKVKDLHKRGFVIGIVKKTAKKEVIYWRLNE
jgi:DNA-binding Lrp family transcriptional regulator